MWWWRVRGLAFADVGADVITKLLLFIALAIILLNSVLSILYGFGILFRDNDKVIRLKESLTDLTQLKPPEIFSFALRTGLTFVVPFLVMYGFMFDIVRSSDGETFWAIVAGWTIVASLLNYYMWRKILQRYESTG